MAGSKTHGAVGVGVAVEGPAWADQGLEHRGGRYPLQVEGPVLNAVDRLLPGISTLSRYVRHYALYAALAAHADEDSMSNEDVRLLLRRSEVVLAAASLAAAPKGSRPGQPHGADKLRRFIAEDGTLDVASAADPVVLRDTYSPRAWGFWADYNGPGTVLGTVGAGGAPLPGQHRCPQDVLDLFAPLFAAAGHDSLDAGQIAALEPIALSAIEAPEVPWLRAVFTATRGSRHDPEDWSADDRRRRGALRMLGRTVQLYGNRSDLSWDAAVEQTVAFGSRLADDPVVAGIAEAPGWGGMLLRYHSVGAWRRLWTGMVDTIGDENGEQDASPQQLRDWVADQLVDAGTVGDMVDALPATMAGGHPLPAETAVLAESGERGAFDAKTNVRLLLIGGRRNIELTGVLRQAFLGPATDFLNPAWVHDRVQEYRNRPASDFGTRLVDDMLAQARRVALAKIKPDRSGRLVVYSRIHQRNGRYYRSSREYGTPLGTRITQMAEIAGQLGLIDLAADGTAVVTAVGAELLELPS